MRTNWKLNYGCHRGTLISRDSECLELPSLEACKARLAEAEAGLKRIGYSVWFAQAVGPNGEQVKLHEVTPYY